MKRNNINVNSDKNIIISKDTENYIYDILEDFENKLVKQKDVFPHPVKLFLSSKTNIVKYIIVDKMKSNEFEIDKNIIKPDDFNFTARIDIFIKNNKIVNLDYITVII